MQRIDENTYIDDTLVTCAEYQLFIDDMREQGKYYQPDHWGSYQFPRGQARESILGVRYADAIAFCKWLTHQRNDEWELRLPSKKEVMEFQIRHMNRTTLGYWLNDQFQFTWIGPAPENARRISLLNIELSLAHDIDAADSRTLPGTFNRGDERTYVFNFFNDRQLDADRVGQLERVRALVLSLPRIIDLDVARDLTHAFNISRNCAVDVTRTLGIISDDSSSAQSQDSLLELYIDLITLQERIAGYSLAFEGIRLVKERIV